MVSKSFDVSARADAQGVVLIPEEIATQMEAHRSTALQFELVGFSHEGIDDGLGVPTRNE